MTTRQGKPTLNELRNALTRTVTLILPERLEGLKQAGQWYMNMKPFAHLDTRAHKLFTKGEMAYTLGSGGKEQAEQETAFATAIRLFEKACDGTNVRFESMKLYEAKLEKERAKLQAGIDAANRKVGPMLDLLTEAFSGFDAKFVVDPKTETGRRLSENREIVYGVDTAIAMMDRVRAGDGASVVLDELPTVVKANALMKDNLGNASVSAQVILNTLERAANALKTFFTVPATDDPSGATKRVRSVAKRTTKRKRTRPVTHYRTGSTMEKILSRLKKLNGKETTVEKLFVGIDAKDPDRFVRMMVRDGETSGKWTMSKERGGRVTFEYHG